MAVFSDVIPGMEHLSLDGTQSEEAFSPFGRDDAIKGPPQACLFIASLSPDTAEEALKAFFSNYGEVLKVKLLKDRSMRPYAFVQYKTIEQADEALQHSVNETIDGRRLRVERAKVNRTLFVAKMDRTISGAQLREIIEEFAPVESVTIIKNHHTNKSKGCGFVKFLYREDAMEAFMGLKNSQRKWVVEWATSPNDPDSLGIDKCNLFVGGLNPAIVTKETLEQRFSAYGTLESVSVINKDTPEISGSDQATRSAYAFIRYSDPSFAATAIEHENGAEWLERRIRVQYCESQEMKNKRRANKYFSTLSQFGNQFYRGVQGPLGGPMVMMGGLPMYNIPQRPPYGRKGEQNNFTNPYLGFPLVNPGMVYGNQPWLYAQLQSLQSQTNGHNQQEAEEADDQQELQPHQLRQHQSPRQPYRKSGVGAQLSNGQPAVAVAGLS